MFIDRFMPRVVFGFSFLYRIFFCLLTYRSAWRNENTLANGIQLIATIKVSIYPFSLQPNLFPQVVNAKLNLHFLHSLCASGSGLEPVPFTNMTTDQLWMPKCWSDYYLNFPYSLNCDTPTYFSIPVYNHRSSDSYFSRLTAVSCISV